MASRGWQLRDVAYRYGAIDALNGVSGELVPGVFHGIIGPNGSGKTTLVDLLLGLRRPSRGEVLFDGVPVHRYGRAALARRMALVPQEFGIDFDFTVREVVMMGRHPYLPRFGAPTAADRRAVDRAMVMLDIAAFADRPITELSGGEKQRVVVARALAQDTPYLLLDEATANLDIRHTLQILSGVRRLVTEAGRTVVAVLHDCNLAAAFCDRLLVLHRGGLAACGPVDAVLTPELFERVFGVRVRLRHDDGRLRLDFDGVVDRDSFDGCVQ